MVLVIMFCVIGGRVYDDDGICEVARLNVGKSSLKSKCFLECDVEFAARLTCFFL